MTRTFIGVFGLKVYGALRFIDQTSERRRCSRFVPRGNYLRLILQKEDKELPSTTNQEPRALSRAEKM